MKSVPALLLIFSAVLLISCGSFFPLKDEKIVRNVAFVDLDYITEYMMSQDEDVLYIKQQLTKTGLSTDEKEKLKEMEFDIKERIYSQIDSAIVEVVKMNGAYIVINKNENMLYGDRQFDLTQEVINELRLRKKLNNPENR